MKKLLNIISVAAILAVSASCSLSGEQDRSDPDPGTQALLTVELVTGGAEEEDYIHTVRYIIFDNASGSPSLDVNESIIVDDGARDSKEFKTTLEVNCNDDKMIVVIVNEPDGITGLLNLIDSPDGLEDITFPMANAFNDQATIPSDTGIPMTGVKRYVSVTQDETAEVKMHVERAVARVDVLLYKDASITAQVDGSAMFILTGSHDKGYLATGTVRDETRYQTDETKNFGHMMTVSNPVTVAGWINSDPPIIINNTPQLICSFYTPERTCFAPDDADKLTLYLTYINTSVGIKHGEAILSKFTSEGGEEKILDTIKRNNVYQIVGLLKTDMIEFECTVLPWEEAGQEIIIDPQYYLNVSDSDLRLPDNGNTATITAETDYAGGRGFPAGILLDENDIDYYDADDNLLNNTAGDKFGWLEVSATGINGDPSREITFTVNNDLSANNRGCYAKTDVTAGNITKRIKITR